LQRGEKRRREDGEVRRKKRQRRENREQRTEGKSQLIKVTFVFIALYRYRTVPISEIP
jgi:hypothetical protein